MLTPSNFIEGVFKNRVFIDAGTEGCVLWYRHYAYPIADLCQVR